MNSLTNVISPFSPAHNQSRLSVKNWFAISLEAPINQGFWNTQEKPHIRPGHGDYVWRKQQWEQHMKKQSFFRFYYFWNY